MKMRTLSSTDCKGMTLLEILIVLTIISMSTGIVSISMHRFSQVGQLHFAANQLLADMKASRLSSEYKNTPSNIIIRQNGYSIDTLNIQRDLGKIQVTSTSSEVIFNQGLPQKEINIQLALNHKSRSFRIDKTLGYIEEEKNK